MKHILIGAVEIIGACVVIALAAVALVLFRPKARRRRRRRRHSRQPKIDLFAAREEAPAEPDA